MIVMKIENGESEDEAFENMQFDKIREEAVEYILTKKDVLIKKGVIVKN
jgi:hypothetical protein